MAASAALASSVEAIDFKVAFQRTFSVFLLLQSIGFNEPDDISISAAVELNDKFIDGLQDIHRKATEQFIAER